jgi:hypothetical protein
LAGWWSGVPELDGAAGCLDLGVVGAAGVGKGVERSLELVGGEVAMHELAELGAAQPVGGTNERGVELFGERVASHICS